MHYDLGSMIAYLLASYLSVVVVGKRDVITGGPKTSVVQFHMTWYNNGSEVVPSGMLLAL